MTPASMAPHPAAILPRLYATAGAGHAVTILATGVAKLDRITERHNAVDHGDCPGEVGLREMMLGMVVVGILAGLAIGRNAERARRTYKDWDAAKTALKKGRSVALGEIRKAAITILLIGGLVVIIFVAANNM
jgi:hypothetical protein